MNINGLEWDDINIEHIIGKHGLSTKEIEDVCFEEHYIFSAKYNRKAVYGQTSSGKYIMVILERIRDSVYRPITARGMTRSEKRRYIEIMK